MFRGWKTSPAFNVKALLVQHWSGEFTQHTQCSQGGTLYRPQLSNTYQEIRVLTQMKLQHLPKSDETSCTEIRYLLSRSAQNKSAKIIKETKLTLLQCVSMATSQVLFMLLWHTQIDNEWSSNGAGTPNVYGRKLRFSGFLDFIYKAFVLRIGKRCFTNEPKTPGFPWWHYWWATIRTTNTTDKKMWDLHPIL